MRAGVVLVFSEAPGMDEQSYDDHDSHCHLAQSLPLPRQETKAPAAPTHPAYAPGTGRVAWAGATQAPLGGPMGRIARVNPKP